MIEKLIDRLLRLQSLEEKKFVQSVNNIFTGVVYDWYFEVRKIAPNRKIITYTFEMKYSTLEVIVNKFNEVNSVDSVYWLEKGWSYHS